MARLNFGAAQDISGLFASMYFNYQNQLTQSARAAISRAEDIQAAEDRDMFNRWQAGEVDDAMWLAYVEDRVTDPTNEPEETSYWKEQMRESEKAINQERISEEARAIVEQINAGQATWDDLYKFYVREKANLPAESQFAQQLEQEINSLEDVMRKTKINADIGQVGYLFESNQISAGEAGKRIRAIAERLKQSDPDEYWDLLTQAARLEQSAVVAGGGGGGGGRRGGGGGGGGGSNSGAFDSISDFRDWFTTQRNFLDAARDAYYTEPSGWYHTPEGQPIHVRQNSSDGSLPGTATNEMLELNRQRLGVEDYAYQIFTELSQDPTLTPDEQADATKAASEALTNKRGVQEQIWDINEDTFGYQFDQRMQSIERWFHLADLDTASADKYLKNAQLEAQNLQAAVKNANTYITPTKGGHMIGTDPGERVLLPDYLQVSPEEMADYQQIADAIAGGFSGQQADLSGFDTTDAGITSTRGGRVAADAVAWSTALQGLSDGTAAYFVDEFGRVSINPLTDVGKPTAGLSGNYNITVTGMTGEGTIDTSAGHVYVRGYQKINGQWVPVYYKGITQTDPVSGDRPTTRVLIGGRIFIKDPATGWWKYGEADENGNLVGTLSTTTVPFPTLENFSAAESFFNNPNFNPLIMEDLATQNDTGQGTGGFIDLLNEIRASDPALKYFQMPTKSQTRGITIGDDPLTDPLVQQAISLVRPDTQTKSGVAKLFDKGDQMWTAIAPKPAPDLTPPPIISAPTKPLPLSGVDIGANIPGITSTTLSKTFSKPSLTPPKVTYAAPAPTYTYQKVASTAPVTSPTVRDLRGGVTPY